MVNSSLISQSEPIRCFSHISEGPAAVVLLFLMQHEHAPAAPRILGNVVPGRAHLPEYSTIYPGVVLIKWCEFLSYWSD